MSARYLLVVTFADSEITEPEAAVPVIRQLPGVTHIGIATGTEVALIDALRTHPTES